MTAVKCEIQVLYEKKKKLIVFVYRLNFLSSLRKLTL